jgi:hypothetical protein
MQKRDEPSTMYSCMMPPKDLWRVDHPHDEHHRQPKRRARRALGKLADLVRS